MVEVDDGRLAQRVMAEIATEVRRRRAAGDLPVGLERELETAFERFAPVSRPDCAGIDAVERTSAIDVDVPLGGGRGIEARARRLLRSAMGWYLNYLVQQLSAYGSGTVRSLRLLAARVGALEEQARWVAGADAGPGQEIADLSHWHALAVTTLGRARGRVLHAECGDGALLRALDRAGADAYGTDPRPHAVAMANAGGLDAWPDDVVTHLGAVADGALGGLVLSGCVDRLGLAGQRSLAGLAGTKLAPGGSVIVLGTAPGAWARRSPPVEVDLAGGRPLHPETWCQLLVEDGLAAVAVHPGPPQPGLGPVPGHGPLGAGLDAALSRLDRDLFGPASYAVVATRPS